jgi:RPA family protein
MPSNVNNYGGHHAQQDKNQDQYGGQKRKNRVFAPVTMKMIQEASPRPDDVCEIDGEAINDIIIVGRVITKQEEPMRTLFEINDNTGTFKVIFYQKGENEVPMALKNFHYE